MINTDANHQSKKRKAYMLKITRCVQLLDPRGA